MKRSDYSRVSGGGAFLADRSAGSQVVCINVIAHLLRNLEFFIKRSRTWCAMTVLNILDERSEFSILCEGFIRGHKVQSTRGQVSIRILRYYVIKAAVSFVKFFLPLLGKDNRMGNNNPYPPLPSPIGDGVSNSHPELVSGSHLVQQQVKHNANFLKRTYSPIHLFTHSLKKRAAFTLAEVLITLGIIGVVAAMTMPSLIQKYKIQEYVSKLNKFYTVISNAYIRAKQDNGDISGWNLAGYESSSSDEEDFLYYILPYMNVVKFCGKNEKGCFSDIIYGSIGSAGFGLNLNNNSWYSNAILNDGMSISSLTYSNTCGNKGAACALLRVDVNGDTTPNKLGIDLHTFAVYKDRILPGGLSGVLDDEQSINRGDACTAHVIYEKNMDYIKDGKCEIYE